MKGNILRIASALLRTDFFSFRVLSPVVLLLFLWLYVRWKSVSGGTETIGCCVRGEGPPYWDHNALKFTQISNISAHYWSWKFSHSSSPHFEYVFIGKNNRPPLLLLYLSLEYEAERTILEMFTEKQVTMFSESICDPSTATS